MDSANRLSAMVNDRPMAMLGLALGGGILLGSITSGGTAIPRRLSRSLGRGKNAESHPSIDRLKAAVVGFAISRAKDYINTLIPGFRRHYEDSKHA